jgi:A/G-specific adenine glycosylase
MLQQTRVDTVVPYFRRFLRRFPTPRSLAEADGQEVLKAWEGLGYYARARNLHRLAQVLVRERDSRFPATREEWATLPGVGPYTAAALASLISGEDVVGVDGNVERVLCRLFARAERPASAAARRDFAETARALRPAGRAGPFNEAMMELGALLCTPRKPLCPDCPFRAVCRARLSGDPGAFPRRAPGKRIPELEVGAAVIRNSRGRILIARRKEKGMLGGLWEFPGGKREAGETIRDCIRRELIEEMGIELEVGEERTVVRHAYSHFRIRLVVHEARIVRGRPKCLHCADFAWIRPDEFDRYPFSRADQIVIERVFPEAGRTQGL